MNRRLFRLSAVALTFALAGLLSVWTVGGEAIAQSARAILVQVTNTTENPVPVRDVIEDAKQPFTARALFNIGKHQKRADKEIEIPAGKRLVGETISAHGYITPNETVQPEIPVIIVQTSFGEGFGTYPVTLSKSVRSDLSGPYGFLYSATQPARFYSNGSFKVFLEIGEFDEGWNFIVTVTGYLVNQPREDGP